MTQKELANIINTALAKMLIEDTSWHKDEMRGNYYTPEMCEITTEEHINMFSKKMMTVTHYKGKEVHVEPVYRKNGTDEDVSMRITIVDWDDHSGRTIAKIKITPAKKEETIIKKVQKFIADNYK